MSTKLTILAALVAVAAQAGQASAQQQPSSAGTITVRQGNSRPLQEALGFNYSAQVVLGVDGVPRAAWFPVIGGVVEGSPAHAAGIVAGDSIVAVNGKDGREPALFRERRPGTRYVMRIRHGQETREVTLVAAPAPARAQ